MYRKGMGLVGIIITVFAILLIVSLFIAFLLRWNAEDDRRLCEISAKTQAFTQIRTKIPFTGFGGPGYALPLPLECPLYDVQFHQKYVERIELKDYAVEENLRVFDPELGTWKTTLKLKPEVINSVIAEELRYCWKQFGAGGTPVFQIMAVDYGGFTGSKTIDQYLGDSKGNRANRQCYICNVISFDPSVTFPEMTDEQKNFGLFLKEQSMPFQQDTTYYEYLTENNGPCEAMKKDTEKSCFDDALDRFNIKQDISFEKEGRYAIIFMREGQQRDIYNAFAYVLPVEQVDLDLCDVFVW